MRASSFLLGALVAASCASASPAPVDSRAAAEPVIAAERAFAERHQSVSVKQSFAEYAAPDGVMLTPDGVRNARDHIATWPDGDDKGLIQWWPALAGIARSGELGFTTGPASFGGGERYTNYFTIWKRQPDGSWKWLIDLGTRKGVKPAGTPDDPVAIVPVSDLPPISTERARADLFSTDQIAGDLFHSDEVELIAQYYAPDALLLGWAESPISGRTGVEAARRARGLMGARTEGGGVSEAGDLGWTYGFASWTEGKQGKRGPYLRVWQRRPEGWRILVENIHAF